VSATATNSIRAKVSQVLLEIQLDSTNMHILRLLALINVIVPISFSSDHKR